MIYTRGSEWNRWDFHIHTPGTLRNDQFSGRTIEEKWNKYYEDIKAYIGDGKDCQHKIVAMGITDYLSIENYKKIINDNILKPIIPFLFPNVELRLTQGAIKSPINIHCLFNPAIVDQLEDIFFSKITFNFKGNPYQATKNSLIRLGKAISPSYSDIEAYHKANEKFLVSFNQLKQVIEESEILKKNTLIAVASKSKDGISGLSVDSQFQLLHDELCSFSDFIFSANPNDILYYLGEKVNGETKAEVINRYGNLKPCIHGSDAHENTKIFEPNEKRYCWIKATPSFEGMKEIIYEPKDRVRIQELRPEEKPAYYVIDKVIIEDENFSPEPIPFNDKLTCIIGGKSTGKSLLLNNVALAIAPEQVKDKYKITNPNKEDLPFYMVENMKVFWKDGIISEKSISQKDRKIVYIPQTYLNKLSDETEETTEIDTIIQDIILQNEEV